MNPTKLKVILSVCLVIFSVHRAAAQQDRRPFLRESERLAKRQALDNFDSRRGKGVGISADRRRLAEDLKKRLGKGSGVAFNPQTGGVHHLFHTAGFLSPPQGGDARSAFRAYLLANAALFALSPADISTFTPAAENRDRGTGVTHLYLQQQLGGIQVFQNSLKGHVNQAGRLVSVEGNYYPGVSRPRSSSALSARDAVLAAMRSTLPDLLSKVASQPRPPSPPSRPPGALIPVGGPAVFPILFKRETGADRLTIFEPGPFAAPIRARQVIFPSPDGSRLAWEVSLHAADRQAYYTILVDADTGSLLYRSNSYRSSISSNAAIFSKNPDATPLATLPFFGSPTASPFGWSSGTATIGNNVQGFSATSSGDFIFPFTDAWKLSGVNNFDLANKRLRFTPNDANASGYSVSVSAAPVIGPGVTNLAPFLSDLDDGTAELSCSGGSFSARVLGQTFSTIWSNTNGSVGFGGGTTWYVPLKADFSLGYRTVAALWTDLSLNPYFGGGTFTGSCLNEGSGKAVYLAWIAVPLNRLHFNTNLTNTFSITIHGIGTGLDNVIDIDFNSVQIPNGMLLGVGGNSGAAFSPATAGIVSYRDLSAGVSPGMPGGVAQVFPDPDLNLSTTNIAYHLNSAHDYFYELGFTSGNFQLSDFGPGGAPDLLPNGPDPVQSESQYYLSVFLYGFPGFNNAFFAFTSDGTPPFTAFGLWSSGSGPSLCRRDSGLDASVIIHEYTHGVTTRMVGGPYNVGVLSSFQGGALGEGWSDAFAAIKLNDPVTGAYVGCNPATGIRSVAYNASPLKYGDFGNRFEFDYSAYYWIPVPGIGQVFFPEYHQDGEIWASALWDLQTALGPAIAGRLVFEALKYTPTEPSMPDARNAILIADSVLYGSSHWNALWAGFAARGLGASSSSSSSSGCDFTPSTLPCAATGEDTIPFAAFDLPGNPLVTEKAVVFFDDFDHGPLGWTTAGADGAGGPALWHLSTRRAWSGLYAWYYGQESSGNYDTGYRNFGALISPAIALPAVGSNAALVLEWDNYKFTEDYLYDGGWVRIIDVGTGSRTQVAIVSPFTYPSPSSLGFTHHRVNLNQFAGKTVKVEFYMDTFDFLYNSFEGWYVDNVKVSLLGSTPPDPTLPR